ncbi:MAG: hypothetical protein HXX10_07535 [Rhodoplanes sp.]|uniref:hypothetical protein n=1 Tax=Rhodoplanes sp. TaxID=1968906 RepID=UPI001837BF99|nr:hypothetical protein [Rhodoplanes sp.]NVO13872.1 hypothetical protein [Rhodoplanes sp.]
MTKEQTISAKILLRADVLATMRGTSRTAEIREAFDFVLGAGAYEALAGDLYDTIRAARGRV